MTVKVSFNGKPVGHIMVTWIGLEEAALCEDRHMPDGVDFYKELFTINSQTIIHEFIEKGIDGFKDITESKYGLIKMAYLMHGKDCLSDWLSYSNHNLSQALLTNNYS